MKKPIVLFDIGDTLMGGAVKSPTYRIIEELGLQRSDKSKVRHLMYGSSFMDSDELIQSFFNEFPFLDRYASEVIYDLWEAQTVEGYALPGAFDVIEEFHRAGFRLGLVSNIWHPFYQSFERVFSRVIKKFEVITLSYKSGRIKPDMTLYKQTLEHFRFLEDTNFINPKKICMIGDSYKNDIEPACQAKLRTVWILNKPQREIGYLSNIVTSGASYPDLILPSIQKLDREKISMLRAIMS
ncbi:MAG: HAD family hydrolase [Vulcanimicrobiota bacterium]